MTDKDCRMRLVLHVGHGKTGTSSIQATMRANAELLAANGIAYPAPEKRDGHSALLAIFKLYETRPRIYRLMPEAGWEKLGRAMRRQIAQSSCDVMVLSCEYLYTQRPEFHQALKKLLNRRFSDISVHAWIRDPVSFFRSYKAQAMLANVAEEDRFVPGVNNASLKHKQRVAVLRSVWGQSNVRLHTYNRDLMAGGNSMLDFIEKALPEVKGLDLEVVQRNVRPTEPLTVEEVEAVKMHCRDDYEFLENEGLVV